MSEDLMLGEGRNVSSASPSPSPRAGGIQWLNTQLPAPEACSTQPMRHLRLTSCPWQHSLPLIGVFLLVCLTFFLPSLGGSPDLSPVSSPCLRVCCQENSNQDTGSTDRILIRNCFSSCLWLIPQGALQLSLKFPKYRNRRQRENMRSKEGHLCPNSRERPNWPESCLPAVVASASLVWSP